ncbi:mechanosensitive ion channel family protein [Qipengyuania gaetbuli]|uniref:mechanosensitive ion channel family protein n=1 Tax=Qipengyuania gaetbuli TaxID=266952 RepID=UPI001CD4132A|nr:mechanosensitive ion channel family protein [Qipengyuania gaetbuli]MCA0910610.1 mechanosensitive ion channel family protein [Qipengyuania gaetbuli]
MAVSRIIALCFAAFWTLAFAHVANAQDAAEETAAPAVEETAADAGEEDLVSMVTRPEISNPELAHLLVPLTADELQQASDTWLGLVRAKTEEIARAQADRVGGKDPADEAKIARIITLVEQRAKLLEKFTLVVDSLERKGGDPDQVARLRAYRNGILFEETSQASAKALFGSMVEWLGRPDGGIALLKRVLVALLALGAIVLAARVAKGFVRLWIGRFTSLSKLLQAFIVGAFFWLFILAGIVIVLASIDVDITPVFALIGGASFILAFAFQDTLGNLASGLMIMINQPFDEGDYIEVGGVGGTVRNVSMVGTTVATPDNRIVIVPNKNVWGNVIVNATASETRRVDLVFGASYGDPIQDVLDVLQQQVAAHPKVLADPAPEIRPTELGASAVTFVCRPWVAAGDYWDVHCDLTRSVKEAFEKRGLTMPYPQQDIHVKSLPSPASA